jgi:hypothetical protein
MSVVSKKRFILEINGIPQFYAQKVTPPKKTFGETKYSLGKRERKVPDGSFVVSDMTVEGLVFSNLTTNFIKEKIGQLLQGFAPTLFMEFGRLIILKEDFITPQKIYEIEEVWLKEFDPGEFDLSSSDAIMEKLVFSVGDINIVK